LYPYHQELNDIEGEAKACHFLGYACNLGLAHSAIGNYENALECQKYFLGKPLTIFNVLL
jgi:hypothetical protein